MPHPCRVLCDRVGAPLTQPCHREPFAGGPLKPFVGLSGALRTGGPLKPSFGLSGDVLRHKLALCPVPQVPARFLGGNLGAAWYVLTQVSVKNRREPGAPGKHQWSTYAKRKSFRRQPIIISCHRSH